jgi:hypothetical protein
VGSWMLRILGWAAGQLFVLVFAFLIWANLFSEYGVLGTQRILDATAAVVLLLLALFFGTLPIRRWHARRREVGSGNAD